MKINGVKVFSTTMHKDRDVLGERITEWMRARNVDIVDMIVTQSSDEAFHCISITLLYFEHGVARVEPSPRSSEQVPSLPRITSARLPARPSGRSP